MRKNNNAKDSKRAAAEVRHGNRTLKSAELTAVSGGSWTVGNG